VEDIKEYFGAAKWREVSAAMRSISSRRQFAFYASLAGIEGFPVQAWYDLYWGQGAFTMPLETLRSQAIFHQKVSHNYSKAARRATSFERRCCWQQISAWHSACARRHLFNLIESKSDE
jgi:hypothetical protein